MKITLKADWGEHKKGDDLEIKDKTVIAALVDAKLIDKPKGLKAETDADEKPEVEADAEKDKSK